MAFYFDKDTNVESKEEIVKVQVKNRLYTFRTDNNVFSKRGLDFGTRTLLDSLDFNAIKGDVLDIGCGYGPIGIIIKSNTDSNVDMIDINERAINLAIKNSKINNVDVNIFSSDKYENISKLYDYIITNPPIRVGKKILYEILIGASNYLKKEGKLIFVINKDQGAKSCIKDMEEYYKVDVLEKNKGFFVIQCQNR